MSSIRIPVFLLILVLVFSAFYLYFDASTSRPTQSFTEEGKADLRNEEKESNIRPWEEKLDKAVKEFNNQNFKQAYETLKNYKDDHDYEIIKVKAYSLAAINRDTEAILEFEKLSKIKEVPQNNYALAYLYEKSGFLDTAHKMYDELTYAPIEPTLKKEVLEGFIRTLAYETDDKKKLANIQNLIKLSPTSELGAVNFVKYCADIKNDKRPKVIIERLLPVHKNNYEFNFWAGKYLINNGFYQLASEVFENCMRIDPENSGAYLYAYKAESRLGNSQKALKMIEKFRGLSLVQISSDILFEASLEAYKQRQLKLSYELYRSAVSSDRKLLASDHSSMLTVLEQQVVSRLSPLEKRFHKIFIKYQNGEYTVALEEMGKLLPQLQQPLKFDGFNLIKECQKVVRQDARYSQYLIDLEQAKREEEAAKRRAALAAKEEARRQSEVSALPDESLVDAIKRKAMLEPTNYSAQYDAAIELSQRGFYQESALFFEMAQRLEPNNHQPAFSLAKLNYLQGNNFSTSQNIKKALDIAPSDTFVLSLAAEIELSKNNHEQAAIYAQKALKSNVNNHEAKIFLAESFANLGEPDEALRLLGQVSNVRNLDTRLTERAKNLAETLQKK